MAQLDPDCLVFPDESRIDTRLTRTHARAANGKRAPGAVPWGHWQRLTVLVPLALDGVLACLSIAATTGTAVLQTFVGQVLVPALRDRPDAVVIMNNIAAHKADAVGDALRAASIDNRYSYGLTRATRGEQRSPR